MNETEKSNNSPSLFESIPQSICESVEPDSLAKEWTTVDFPNALPVDAIPHAEPVTSDSHNSRQSLSDRVCELDQQNQALRRQKDDLIGVLEKQDQEFHTQIANLNKALQQTRNMLRLERRNWESQSRQIKQRSHEQTAHITQQTQELATTQEQVIKLFRELEHAQQTAQRQQILVETLTHQLEASQEQVAQLERECAHTQQRYSDQTQLVHQTENACKDLRSRLLRQQRYTMQFKAALEKCLDVPVAKADSFDLPLETGAGAIRQDVLNPASDLAPKAQPVQPWSAQPEFLEDPLEPLSAYVPSPWDEDSELEEPEDQIFQSQDFDSTFTELIVDEPFEHSVILAPTTEPAIVSYTIQRSPEPDASLPEIQLFTPDQTPAIAEEVLGEHEWALVDLASLETESDLEQKFDSALQALEAPVEPFASDSELASLRDDQEILNEIHAIEESADPAPELKLFEPEKADPISDSEPSSSPFITLRSTAANNLDLQPVPEGEAPLLKNGPSPIVYPLRSSKKLKSLAAVDLPSFPRPSK